MTTIEIDEAELARLRAIEVAARKAEKDCRRFVMGTFARLDEIKALASLDDLRAALSVPA